MTDEELIAELADLPASRLMTLLNTALSDRAKKKVYANGDTQYDDVICVATCTFGSNDGIVDECAIVEVCAQPTNDAVVLDDFSEQGRCEVCSTLLIANAKKAVCPICGTVNHLT
ncbi:MAG: hypothetical protein AAGL69_12500 [Pseudomonadota bacterium]